MVSCQMYELLSLVPELRVKSYDYDKFMSETVASIWKQISMDTLSPRVLAEAYNTLSKFPMDCHVLKQLPAAVSFPKNVLLYACHFYTDFFKINYLKISM